MRLLLALAFFVLATLAGANPKIWKAYLEHYKFPAGSDAANAMCLNCHIQPPVHNAFGKLVKQTMLGQGTPRMLTPEVLRVIESQDSDGDGWTNGEEAMAGFNPGDPKSHPPGSPPKRSSFQAKAVAGAVDSPLIPRHTFHPVIVHFPIALFMFGAFLEFLGLMRRDNGIRSVAFWNLLFGALSTAIAIPTGLIAAYRLGWPLTPGSAVFLHLSLGIISALLMTSVVLWRRKSVSTSKAYWLLLLLTAGIVGLAGHFGGQMVYG